MRRGLVFSKYDTRAATTRQRFVQAIPSLAQADITIDIAPLFGNRYLDQFLSHGKRSAYQVVLAYAARLRALLTRNDYDFLWVHCELFPYLPGIFESLVTATKKPVIYDYDDAIFHQYDLHRSPLVRAVLGKKLQSLLRHADIAFCGNKYLQVYAENYCKRTEIIPTTVDVNLYQPLATPRLRATPVLGWIGSPSTWHYCQPLMAVCSSFLDAERLSMLVVGAEHTATPRHGIEFRTWQEESEIRDLQAMDIGIMPIPDEPWARGKCGYKLIQYMACGLPVIASPVGVNCEIVQHGVNGFLAATQDEWREAMEKLATDATLRQRMGAAGRITVEQHYSIQYYGPRIAQLMDEVLTSRQPRA